MTKKKYAIYLGSRFLSGFYPNGYGDVFKFRRNDIIGPWTSIKNASSFLMSIRKQIRDEIKTGRWDEKEINNNKRIAKNLKVKEWGGFY